MGVWWDRHTNTNSPPHTPLLLHKLRKKKNKKGKKERSTKDVASFVFPFQI